MNGHRAGKIDAEVTVGLGRMLCSWKRSVCYGLGEPSAEEPERFNDSGCGGADSTNVYTPKYTENHYFIQQKYNAFIYKIVHTLSLSYGACNLI